MQGYTGCHPQNRHAQLIAKMELRIIVTLPQPLAVPKTFCWSVHVRHVMQSRTEAHSGCASHAVFNSTGQRAWWLCLLEQPSPLYEGSPPTNWFVWLFLQGDRAGEAREASFMMHAGQKCKSHVSDLAVLCRGHTGRPVEDAQCQVQADCHIVCGRELVITARQI